MSSTGVWSQILGDLIFIVPGLGVCVAGIILAIVRMGRYRRTCVLTLIGFSIIGGTSLASPIIYAMISNYYNSQNWPISKVTLVYKVIAGINAMLWTSALLSLLMAIFSNRPTEQGHGFPVQPIGYSQGPR